MSDRWSDARAAEFLDKYGKLCGEDLALRIYSSRLLGEERSLVLHGGGNTSVKNVHVNLLREKVKSICVKASGYDMARIEPEGMPCLDLAYLKRLRALDEIDDAAMVNELRTHLFDQMSPTPSIEAFLHAFIPKKYVDHTHAEGILTLTNQVDGEHIVKEALGSDVIVLDYVKAGFKLAKLAADAFDASPNACGMVLMHHGLVTWGDTARESYERTIELVTKANDYISAHTSAATRMVTATPVETAMGRLSMAAPVLRGILSKRLEDFDNDAHARLILLPIVARDALDFVDCDGGKELALTPPLTPDYLIRTKSLPMWIDAPAYDDRDRFKVQINEALASYIEEYEGYVVRNTTGSELSQKRFDPLPRVIMMPGLGVLCAGQDVQAATIARDVTIQAMSVKSTIAGMHGVYKGLSERDLFGMEYYSLQHAKLGAGERGLLSGKVGLITGAAGAIGSGISRGLLKNGCHVAVTDLPSAQFDSLVEELKSSFGDRVIGVPMDVTDSVSVSDGIDEICRVWGGVDIAIVNAGVAHVSALKDMELAAFQKLEQVNVEGTLLVLKHMARHFELQEIGGDVVLVSTKNVFAPGAGFGAYSATKAASHQLARIASLELAPMGVRVNMVAPDAVFSDGSRKSGLWNEVGPARMAARGLDEKGLEDYYQSRNLLKSKVTADHVANAVMFLASRQTPTTGATIPVDGGLPDATPR